MFCMCFLPYFLVTDSRRGKADDERKEEIVCSDPYAGFFKGVLDSCLMIKFLEVGRAIVQEEHVCSRLKRSVSCSFRKQSFRAGKKGIYWAC